MPGTTSLHRKPVSGSGSSGSPWAIERSGRGVVFARSATAGEPEPAEWRQRLVTSLQALPNVAVVAAKRLAPDGRLFSMGEFTIHPKGFHHLGQGVDGGAYRFPEEVDAFCGGVLAIDEAAFDRAEGDRLLASPLGSLDLCLTLRLGGGRCVAIPEVVITDASSPLDGAAITRPEHEAFIARWGFDWRAADLDAVKHRHGGTGLLWNVRFFGQAMPFAKYEQRPCMHWKSYAEVDVYRKRADALAGMVLQVTPKGSPPATVLDLGCGDGLFTHLLALGGARTIGLDPEESAVRQAGERVAEEITRGSYPGPAPQFLAGYGQSLPVEPASVHTVAMLDVIEHLANPVAVLREVERVLAPGGHLVISTPAWQYGGWSDPIYHVCEYSLPELIRQIQAATHLKACNTGRIGGVYRDVIVIAGKDHDSNQAPTAWIPASRSVAPTDAGPAGTASA